MRAANTALICSLHSPLTKLYSPKTETNGARESWIYFFC